MNANVRNEEVSPFGDFVLTSYARDFDAIKSKFPKMDADFKAVFIAKLDFVKELESSLLLSENKKGVTASLYEEAKRLNEELNYLSAYFDDASLNTGIVSSLKADLTNHNIEGAILKLEGLKQFVVSHQSELEAEGMNSEFVAKLAAYKESLTAKNKAQNELLNNRKKLTDLNKSHYDELLRMIKKILRNGKLVFKGTVTEDEYTSKMVVQRMRAAKRKQDEDGGKE